MNAALEQAQGYYWPAGFAGHAKRYVRALKDLERFLRLLPPDHAGAVVQAGGHCGLWPRRLAARFGRVYTFEPDAANFAALVANIERVRERVYPARGLLGAEAGPAQLAVHAGNSGGHHMRMAPGPVPVYRIDDLALAACDAIVLDVEGAELEALAGAERTLFQHRPWLLIEVRGHIEKKLGHGSDAELRRYLAAMRYRQDRSIAHDEVWIPCSS